jgi:hypothetical protein
LTSKTAKIVHFFIACSLATVYYLARRKLPFLTEYPIICGLDFCTWVELFMNLVVLPPSPLHAFVRVVIDILA